MSKHNLGEAYPAATQKLDKGVLGVFSAAERILLVIISLLTMLAVALELAHFADSGRIRLADLLLLFIYLEVIGMAYAYYACLLYTSPSPRDQRGSRMPSSA